MPNQPQLILLDLDGTLLNSEEEVSTANKEVLQNLQQQGNKIAIATGRHHKEAKKVTKDLDELSYITTNGSYIEDAAGQEIFSSALETKSVLAVIDIIEDEFDLEYFLFTKDSILANKQLDITLQVKKDLQEYMRLKKPVVHKVFATGDSQEISAAKDKIKAKLEAEIALTSSSPKNLEVTATNISKGRGLNILAEHLGIPVEKTIAFGDSTNDMKLLKEAQIAVAMGNCEVEELKEEADIIAPTNENDGVAEILKELLL